MIGLLFAAAPPPVAAVVGVELGEELPHAANKSANAVNVAAPPRSRKLLLCLIMFPPLYQPFGYGFITITNIIASYDAGISENFWRWISQI
jgi:hypothetical protein